MTICPINLKMPIQIAYSGRDPFLYDLCALLYIGGAAEAPTRSRSISSLFSAKKLIQSRIPVVTALHDALHGQTISGASKKTLGGSVYALRRFWIFCERKNIELNFATVDQLRSAISVWVINLWEQVRRREIKEKSAGTYAWNLTSLFSLALNLPQSELLGRIRMPSSHANGQNPQYEKMDLAIVDGFLQDMEDIIISLSLEAIYGKWPIPITFRHGRILEYRGAGGTKAPSVQANPDQNERKTRRKNSDISFSARRSIVNIRVQAECLRFMGMTGMNLQPALELCVGNITYRSHRDQYEIRGFKNRKGGEVQVYIAKSYRASFDSWLKIRSKLFAEKNCERLFPMLNNRGEETSNKGERGFIVIANILRDAGRPRIPAQILRFARVQKVLRVAAIKENLNTVALDAQNSLPVLVKNYLRGSQQMAMAELGKFIVTIEPAEVKERVRSGGSCVDPYKPGRIKLAADTVPKPDCVNPAGCMFCINYQAIRSFDYLHSVLSYKEFLRLRSAMSAHEFSTWDTIIRPTMERIDEYVSAIIASGESMNKALDEVRNLINRGSYHAAWNGWIELFREVERV